MCCQLADLATTNLGLVHTEDNMIQAAKLKAGGVTHQMSAAMVAEVPIKVSGACASHDLWVNKQLQGSRNGHRALESCCKFDKLQA